jgi:hypothetical protein
MGWSIARETEDRGESMDGEEKATAPGLGVV